MTISKHDISGLFLMPDIHYPPSEKWTPVSLDVVSDLPTHYSPLMTYKLSDLGAKQYESLWHPSISTAKAVADKRVAYVGVRERLIQAQKKRAAEVRRISLPIERSIEASRKILAIEENWDGEGSPAYAEATWKRATKFVRDTAIPFMLKHRSKLQPPKITPGPEGSIDVRWISERRTLLINFPANENATADFYGHDKRQDVIKGTLDLASRNHWLLLWLTR